MKAELYFYHSFIFKLNVKIIELSLIDQFIDDRNCASDNRKLYFYYFHFDCDLLIIA